VDLGHLSGILTGVLTVTTIIVGALLGLQRGTMSNIQTRADELSKTANDLRGRIGDLEKELAEVKAKAAQTEAEIRADAAELHVENQILKELNAQSVDWNAVIDLLTHHHGSAEKHWANLDGALVKVHDALRLVADRLAQQKRQIDDQSDA
jgi:chromosome segregation ATPase